MKTKFGEVLVMIERNLTRNLLDEINYCNIEQLANDIINLIETELKQKEK